MVNMHTNTTSVADDVARLEADPRMQGRLDDLQDDACAAFSAIVDKTAAILLKGSTPAAQTSVPDLGVLPGPLAARLAMESKQRQQAWQNARETAELLVIGTLLNQDNPDWDPADPASCRMTEQSTLLALLKLGGDEPEDGQP